MGHKTPLGYFLSRDYEKGYILETFVYFYMDLCRIKVTYSSIHKSHKKIAGGLLLNLNFVFALIKLNIAKVCIHPYLNNLWYK